MLSEGFVPTCIVQARGSEPDMEPVAGCRVLRPDRVNHPDVITAVRALEPDLFVLSGYDQILRRELLGVPGRGTINLHGGKLPEYRGTAPINWQIINGERVGGCAVLFADEGIDTGDILDQRSFPIEPEDDAQSVLIKTLELFPGMLTGVLRRFQEGDVQGERQDLQAGAYYTRRYERDGKIDWRGMRAETVHNLVRALVPPYPGAFTERAGERIAILKSRIMEEAIHGIPGRVPLKRPSGVVVIAADRGLLVETVLVAGETVAARDFFQIGEDLG